MREIEKLKHFVTYAAYDPGRTSLSEEAHAEWVRGMLRYCSIGLYTLVYESMEDDPQEAKALVDELVEDLSVLVPLLPGDANLPQAGSLQDEIKFQLQGLLERLEERQGELKAGR